MKVLAIGIFIITYVLPWRCRNIGLCGSSAGVICVGDTASGEIFLPLTERSADDRWYDGRCGMFIESRMPSLLADLLSPVLPM